MDLLCLTLNFTKFVNFCAYAPVIVYYFASYTVFPGAFGNYHDGSKFEEIYVQNPDTRLNCYLFNVLIENDTQKEWSRTDRRNLTIVTSPENLFMQVSDSNGVLVFRALFGICFLVAAGRALSHRIKRNRVGKLNIVHSTILSISFCTALFFAVSELLGTQGISDYFSGKFIAAFFTQLFGCSAGMNILLAILYYDIINGAKVGRAKKSLFVKHPSLFALAIFCVGFDIILSVCLYWEFLSPFQVEPVVYFFVLLQITCSVFLIRGTWLLVRSMESIQESTQTVRNTGFSKLANRLRKWVKVSIVASFIGVLMFLSFETRYQTPYVFMTWKFWSTFSRLADMVSLIEGIGPPFQNSRKESQRLRTKMNSSMQSSTWSKRKIKPIS